MAKRKHLEMSSDLYTQLYNFMLAVVKEPEKYGSYATTAKEILNIMAGIEEGPGDGLDI